MLKFLMMNNFKKVGENGDINEYQYTDGFGKEQTVYMRQYIDEDGAHVGENVTPSKESDLALMLSTEPYDQLTYAARQFQALFDSDLEYPKFY